MTLMIPTLAVLVAVLVLDSSRFAPFGYDYYAAQCASHAV